MENCARSPRFLLILSSKILKCYTDVKQVIKSCSDPVCFQAGSEPRLGHSIENLCLACSLLPRSVSGTCLLYNTRSKSEV